MQRVLILGASGLVGGNCKQYFESTGAYAVKGTFFSYEAPGTHFFNTLNLEDPKNFDIQEFNPDIILHCGALTWVDYCEEHVDESYEKTVQSTLNAIELAKVYNAKLVYISTDYVFDGKSGPYNETFPVNPLSIYGKHKLEAEQEVEQLKEHLIIRITNVYGDELRNKNFIARLLEMLKANEEKTMTLPFDQYATPVNAADIARALHCLLQDKKTGTYNIASTDFVNRVQLATHVLKYFPTHKITIEPVSTEQLAPPAKRPLIGGLISAKFLREYPNFHFTNVDDYLRKKTGDLI